MQMHVGQPRKEHFPGKVVHLCTGGDLGRLGRPGSLNPFPTDYHDAVLDGRPAVSVDDDSVGERDRPWRLSERCRCKTYNDKEILDCLNSLEALTAVVRGKFPPPRSLQIWFSLRYSAALRLCEKSKL